MPNRKNNATSSHVDAAATVAPDKGIFYFTFPYNKEATAIPHVLAAVLSDRQKKKAAYEWLMDCVLPSYDKIGHQNLLQLEFKKKYHEILEKYCRCLEDRDALFEKLKMWLLNGRLN